MPFVPDSELPPDESPPKPTGSFVPDPPKAQPRRKSLAEQLKFAGDQIVGLFDVAGAGIQGSVENIVGAVVGVGHAARGGDYMEGAEYARRQISRYGRSTEPQTEGGQLQARVLGNLVEATQIPALLQSAARRTTAPPAVKDFAGAAFEALTLGKLPKRPPTPTQTLIDQGRQQGYLFVPHTPTGQRRYAGTRPERLAEGVAGPDVVESVISTHNQIINDARIAQSVGLKGDFINPKALDDAIKVEQTAYSALKNIDAKITIRSGQFFNDLAEALNPKAIAQRRPTEGVAFEQAMMDRVVAGGGEWPVKDIVNTIEKFRADAFRNLKSTEQATRDLGAFQRTAADLLETELDSGLAQLARSTGAEGEVLFGNMLRGYRQARSNLTNLYAVRDSINPSTGTLDMSKLAKESAERRLNPIINDASELYQASPGSFRNVDRSARRAAIPLTASDATFGILAASAGTAATGSKYGMMAALAPIASRYLAREYATRGNLARRVTGGAAATLPTFRRGAVLGYEASQGEEE